jgi:hypothetical protein
MVRLLMAAGADARKGIFPHRDATTAFALARDRGYADIVAAIEEEEQHRREAMSCPNATVSPVQDQINRAIRERRQRRSDPAAGGGRIADPRLRPRRRDAAARRRGGAATRRWWRGCWASGPTRASRI